MQILNMTKANNTLFKSDAHACIRILSRCLSNNKRVYYLYMQQTQIAADAASIVL